MDTGNKTSFRHSRFLGEDYRRELFDTFNEAYSDYLYQFALTEDQFNNHLTLNGVDLDRSVGMIDDGKLVGFSLNGFGDWDGLPTVYDAGTGVIPSQRRRGVSNEMFALMDKVFPSQGFRQMLLEVISANLPAIKLYERLGFETTRELALLECVDEPAYPSEDPNGVDFAEIEQPDWDELAKMCEGTPSWQNSNEAIDRSRHFKTILGAFVSGECVGFAAFSTSVGRLAQIAVRADQAGRGIASAFVKRMRHMADPAKPLQVVNSPRNIDSAVKFFEKLGFREKLVQFEMIKQY